MKTNDKRRKRYSEEFRKEVAKLVEGNKLTIPEVCRLYDVCYDTVKRWVKKYGKKPYPETIRIKSLKDVDRLKELEKQVEELQRYIGKMHIKMVYQSKVIEFVKEEYGEDFEKKISSEF